MLFIPVVRFEFLPCKSVCFYFTRNRLRQSNVPHPVSKQFIFSLAPVTEQVREMLFIPIVRLEFLPCNSDYLQIFEPVGADIIRPLFYCHPILIAKDKYASSRG